MFYLRTSLCLFPVPRRVRRGAGGNAATAAIWQVAEQDPGGGILLSNHKPCLLCSQPLGGRGGKTERGRSRHKSCATLPLHLSHSVFPSFFFLQVFIYLVIYLYIIF